MPQHPAWTSRVRLVESLLRKGVRHTVIHPPLVNCLRVRPDLPNTEVLYHRDHLVVGHIVREHEHIVRMRALGRWNAVVFEHFHSPSGVIALDVLSPRPVLRHSEEYVPV
jgi:hypothetical protein